MRQPIPLIVLLLVSASVELSAETALFFTSTPMGANVVVDGSTLSKKTPVLIRNLSSGVHTIELFKLGYISTKKKIFMRKDTVLTFNQILEYQYIPLVIPTHKYININAKPNSRGNFLLKDGTYRFKMQQESLDIIPVYPGQRFIDGLNIAIPLLVILSGALTVNEIYNPHNTSKSLSGFTLFSFGVNTALIAADGGLLFARDKYYKNFSIPESAVETDYPETIYKTAEQMFSAGELDKSLYYLDRILKEFTQSDIYPYALFKAAKINIVKDNSSLAQKMLLKLVNDYPVPELYNTAVKSLSDIYLRNGEYKESLDQLSLIIFTDHGFTREDIDFQRYKILKKWAESDKEKNAALKSHIESMVQNYPDSPRYNLYIRILSTL